MEIEKRKLDYVYLLQSLITMPTGDPRDGLEVRLFGGNTVSSGVMDPDSTLNLIPCDSKRLFVLFLSKQ